MGIGLIWRKVQGAAELGDRLAILSLVEEAPPPIEVECRHLALLALLAGEERQIDGVRPGSIRMQRQAFETARHWLSRRRRALFPFRGLRRALSRYLTLANGLGDCARSLKRRRAHRVCFSIGRIELDGFAQPVDGRLGIPLYPVGVSQIERIVGILWRCFEGTVKE